MRPILDIYQTWIKGAQLSHFKLSLRKTKLLSIQQHASSFVQIVYVVFL